MFRHCIFCHGKLPPNQSVEHFPVGRRIAFDPVRGRLWAVCPACSRWNLAPLEDRWEALEELERTRRDLGRVVSSTDNIALIRAGELELVRVGDARLLEEAWWRYGQELLRRRNRSRLNGLLRYRKFGRSAWQGRAECITCETPLEAVSFRRSRHLHLTRDSSGERPALHMRCRTCRSRGRVGEHQLEGVVAEHVLRRVMTFHHFNGASENRVRAASAYIDGLGSPDAVAMEIARSGIRLDRLFDRDRRTLAVALEIALNEDSERRLLEMELSELEARWRQEEEIAAIADSLLTPSIDTLPPLV